MESGINKLLSSVQRRNPRARKGTGWHIIDGRELKDRAGLVLQDVEDLTRFVCEYLKYPPRDAWQMPVYEFYRDVVRAYGLYEAHKREIEKLNAKK